MRNVIIAMLLLVALAGCRTVGVATTAGGYAEVNPTVANEMILDSWQVVIFDIRSTADYRGPRGHLPTAVSAPLDSIEKQLPELLPYQKDTVLVYGNTSTDGALGAKLLTLAGFRNVVHISGGLDHWIDLGYRTVNSAQ